MGSQNASDPFAALYAEFNRVDLDRTGSLSQKEVLALVQDLLGVMNTPVNPARAHELAAVIMTEAAKATPGSLLFHEFVEYVKMCPDQFGPLLSWQSLFHKYARAGDSRVHLDGLGALVTDIAASHNQVFNPQQAMCGANTILAAADTDKDGALSFHEFVSYGLQKPKEFGKLLEGMGKRVGATLKRLGSRKDAGDLYVALRAEFARLDADDTGALELNELMVLVYDVLGVTQTSLSQAEAYQVASTIMVNAGKTTAGSIYFREFVEYAQDNPEQFGALLSWQSLFQKYAEEADSQVHYAGVERLVTDIMRSHGQTPTASAVVKGAQTLLAMADTTKSGALSWREFVAYGLKKPTEFGKLLEGSGQRVRADLARCGSGNSSNDPYAALRAEFDRVDSDKSGALGLNELMLLVADLLSVTGAQIPLEQAQATAAAIMVSAAKTSPGSILFSEFVQYAKEHANEFGELLTWQSLFHMYEETDNKIHLQGVQRLVADILVSHQIVPRADLVTNSAQAIIAAGDTDRDGALSFNEFVVYAKRKPTEFSKLKESAWQEVNATLTSEGQQTSPSDPVAVLRAGFARLDTDNTGTLDLNELTVLVKELLSVTGNQTTEEDARLVAASILGHSSKHISGAISFPEFVEYVKAHSNQFGNMLSWQSLFLRYAEADNEIHYPGVERLVTDIIRSHNKVPSAPAIIKLAKKILTAADTDLNGALSFTEFVSYGAANHLLFAKLVQEGLVSTTNMLNAIHTRDRSRTDRMSIDQGGRRRSSSLNEVYHEQSSTIAALFVRLDSDGDGSLNVYELRTMVLNVALTNSLEYSDDQAMTMAHDMVRRYGFTLQGHLTYEEFLDCLACEPTMLGALVTWQVLFTRYANHGMIHGHKLLQLVWDVLSANGHIDPNNYSSWQQTQATVTWHAHQILSMADRDLDGAVGFGEFVLYAKDHPELFGKLYQQANADASSELNFLSSSPRAARQGSPHAEPFARPPAPPPQEVFVPPAPPPQNVGIPGGPAYPSSPVNPAFPTQPNPATSPPGPAPRLQRTQQVHRAPPEVFTSPPGGIWSKGRGGKDRGGTSRHQQHNPLNRSGAHSAPMWNDQMLPHNNNLNIRVPKRRSGKGGGGKGGGGKGGGGQHQQGGYISYFLSQQQYPQQQAQAQCQGLTQSDLKKAEYLAYQMRMALGQQ